VTISLAGTLFFTISPEAAKGKVVLYLLLTITPFAVVAPALSPLLDRGSYARRASMAVASVGSAVLVLLMAADIRGLLLFPEAFGVLVLSKLYLVAKAALVPSMTETEDDLASANAKLAVLATLAGFVASPVAVGLLQLGAPWVLRLGFVVFLLGGFAALRLPKSGDAVLAKPRARRPMASPSSDRRFPPKGARYDHRALPRRAPGDLRQRAPGADQRPLASASGWVFRCMPRGGPFAGGDVVIRGSVGFLTFFLAFALRHLHAATWVVRPSSPDQCNWLAARIASRACDAQVSVRAAADPLFARAVRAVRRHRRGLGLAVGPTACSPWP